MGTQSGYPINMKKKNAHVIFVMGVSGVGKSTIGNLLSEELEIPIFDGDDYHPDVNILKMSRGQALDDTDRLVWLQSLNKIAIGAASYGGCIIVCSALKKSYREILSTTIEANSKWVFLNGPYELINERIQKRKGHFMSSDLLKSQFDSLEAPQNAINVAIELSPNEIVDVIKKQLVQKSEFGLFGLGVMGRSLARNLANHGVKLSLYNRHVDGQEENVAKNFKNSYEELSSTLPFDNIEGFVNSLQKPRKIMLMVNAGNIVDAVIDNLFPFLEEGDILIDGGNSHYQKTQKRIDYLGTQNIHFVGAGVSGGEQGALYGPSIMVGCNKEVYKEIHPFLETIAAKDGNSLPCCTLVGAGGSGHFVKMVHNGIEYVEMQLLAEVVAILKTKGYDPDQISSILEVWKETANSYLLEITIDILRKRDGKDWLVNRILDKAGNKGTGNWTTITSTQLGVPSTMIASALFARYTSFYKEERIAANKNFESDKILRLNVTIDSVLNAYQFSRLINHYQGFKLIKEASEKYNWCLDLSELSRIWTNGCIIQSDLMVELVTIFKESDNLLLNEDIIRRITNLKSDAKKVVSACILAEVAIPNLSDAINFLNSFAVANSSANIIQAQRDYFGAHRYQRNDDVTNSIYHTDWVN